MNFNLLLEELLLELSGTEIYKKYYSKIPYDTFVDIVMSDPKSNIDGDGSLRSLGKYSKLLLSFYQKGSLQIEDLEKAKEYLGYVYQHNVALDINKLKGLGDLYKVVQKYIVEDTLDLKEILNALVIGEDYKLLNDGEDWTFYQPLTQKGASYLGYSTEWCTTWGEYCLNKKNRDRTNYFNQYGSKGPLFIMINKNNPTDKYQFHFESAQYMDKDDRRINIPAFWYGKEEIKNYFFPSLVRETNQEEIKSEVKRLSILPDEDGMIILRKSIGVVNNELVDAILTDDEDRFEDLIDGEERDGSVYINRGRFIIQVDKLKGDAEDVDRCIDQYRMEGNNGYEWVYNDNQGRYEDDSSYKEDIEVVFKKYYEDNVDLVKQEFIITSYDQFKDQYFDNYVSEENIKDVFVDDITELSYQSYQIENDREADEIEKYLSFGNRSDELNFSIVFFVQFLIKNNINRIGYDSVAGEGLSLQDVTDMYISNYKLTTEIEEPVYNYDLTFPKYGDNNYVSKKTDEYFDRLIDNPEINSRCIELRKQLNYTIDKFFKNGYGLDRFENDHVKVVIRSTNINCEFGTIFIDYYNKDNDQNFYNKSIRVENLPKYLTNYELSLKENKKIKLVVTEDQLSKLKNTIKEKDVDERSRSFAFTRKKRKFSQPERMSNPLRYKESDRVEEYRPLTDKQVKSIEDLNKDAKFLTCRNCRKKFTQTTYKNKKSLPICPYCGTHNK